MAEKTLKPLTTIITPVKIRYCVCEGGTERFLVLHVVVVNGVFFQIIIQPLVATLMSSVYVTTDYCLYKILLLFKFILDYVE